MVKSKIRKKYMGPAHLWQQGRIKEESQLKKEYGYKNKKKSENYKEKCES